MKTINLIFPNQLFADSALIKNGHICLLIEEYLFFRQYNFHKQKIALHRASMKAYEAYLKNKSLPNSYIESTEERSDVRKLIPTLKKEGVSKIITFDPVDDWLENRIQSACQEHDIKLELIKNPLFLNSNTDLATFFRPTKKKFFQTEFYIQQRKTRKILVDPKDNPIGGKWSFDTENRKKYPKKATPPSMSFPDKTIHYSEALDYVKKHFSQNLGHLSSSPIYPIDESQAQNWFRQFLETRFSHFGDYEDAIVKQESILHHSVLTPGLNIGLITPEWVLNQTLDYANEHDISINSLEGFIRQIIGWREFIRGVYITKGTQERTTNYWGFSRKIPSSFYDGSTGIKPVDITIKKVLQTGYCHHIERLMILGNFMLLCEFDPDEVYRWFMELFIDSYDWVMVPNVYGMSQFADGGLMSTKPYISGSNYIMKMSNYDSGAWQQTWDALFWRFMHVHRSFFSKNPRLNILLGTFDKWNPDKKHELLETADSFLSKMN